MPTINGEWVDIPKSETLNSLGAKLDKLLAHVVAPEANPAGAPTPQGKPAATVAEALINAYMCVDADGFPHRYLGDHAGSIQDWAQHVRDNNLEYPPTDYSIDQMGHKDYADWKDPYLALYLLAQSDGLKTPKEISLLGFAATAYQEKIASYGWKATTAAEWFDKIRSTNGQGGASGGSV